MFIRVMYCCLTLGLYFKEKNLKLHDGRIISDFTSKSVSFG